MEKLNCTLLIDDDDVTNALSRQIITKLDFSKEIRVCHDGIQAIDFLMEFQKSNNGQSPELILIDISMPGMDGFEFLELYNNLSFTNKEKVTSIILTTSTDLKYIRKAKKMGVQDYLIKPLTKNSLVQILKQNRILV